MIFIIILKGVEKMKKSIFAIFVAGLMLATLFSVFSVTAYDYVVEEATDAVSVSSDSIAPLNLNYRAEGEIYSSMTGAPIANAKVRCVEGGEETWTDSNGYYNMDFGTTNPGEINLRVSRIFYYTQTQRADYMGNGVYYTDFCLVPVFPHYNSRPISPSSTTQQSTAQQNSNVDIKVEFCGLPYKSTKMVSLSSSQLIELETTLNAIGGRLEKVTSNQEVITIFSSLFSTLRMYNLLPDNTTCTLLLDSVIVRLAKSNEIITGSDDHTNNWCTVIGKGCDAKFLGVLWVGEYWMRGDEEFYPVQGWVWSKGQQGIIYKEGSLWGQLDKIVHNNPDSTFTVDYIGGTGFIGIWMAWLDFYVGTARQIGIDTHWPGYSIDTETNLDGQSSSFSSSQSSSITQQSAPSTTTSTSILELPKLLRLLQTARAPVR
jgi:hypothetical protein